MGDDTFKCDNVFLKPFAKYYDFWFTWKLISKDFKVEGVLTLKIQPDIENNYRDILTENPLKVGRIEENEIEDVIILKKEDK